MNGSLRFVVALALVAWVTAARADVRGLPGAADILEHLALGSITLGERPETAAGRSSGDAGPAPERLLVSEAAVVEALAQTSLTDEQAAALWASLAKPAHAALATPLVVGALAARTASVKAREALWTLLAELAKPADGAGRRGARDVPLLAVFEGYRKDILSKLPSVRESEGAGDELMNLLATSRVLGASTEDGLAFMLAHHPAAVARRIERERSRGKPVAWEKAAYTGLLRWKDAHIVPAAPKAAATLASRDADGETFITIFNALHALGDDHRAEMLKGLGPVEVFNAVVGAEQELYRLGTSGYRGFLHPTIMKGIKAAGSLDAFLQGSRPSGLEEDISGSLGRRGMVFLRVASSFGLLDQVLETIRDRDLFIAETLTSVGDPTAFETNNTAVVDILTAKSGAASAEAFRRALRDRLLERYRGESDARRRLVYGSMLAVYQAISGVHLDDEIARAFPLDRAPLLRTFDQLFSPDGRGKVVHRVFMRLDQDTDALSVDASFHGLMDLYYAAPRDFGTYKLYRVVESDRTIEFYVNKPTAQGVKEGVRAIAQALAGKRVETVIGRGHTGIVAPFQAAAREVVGDRMSGVATVFVGTCGGNASVRELVGTFGYVPVVTTKATGRQVLNNAVIEHYIDALRALKRGQTMSMTKVLDAALAPYRKPKTNAELREDADLYLVNQSTVLAALIYDTHVRRLDPATPLPVAQR